MSEPPRHLRALFGLGLAVALQLALTLWFVPPAAVLSGAPLSGGDYDTHAEQTYRVVESLSRVHRSWVYDVHLHAGFPNGTVFDADNKAWELFTFALHALGVPQALAFNLFVWLAFAVLPLTLFAAARVYDLPPESAALTALLSVFVWFFDAFTHWLWFVGTISFLLAAYGAVLACALFQRWLGARKPSTLAWLTVLLCALHLVHPYVFVVLAPAFLFSYLRARRELTAREHVGLVAMCASVIAGNLFWISNALRNFHYVLDSAYMMAARLPQLGFDFLELLEDPSNTGLIANHTGFRVLVFALGVVGLAQLRRTQHASWRSLTLNVAWLSALAYLGGHVPPLRQIQPYRFLLPAMFFATLPAGHALATLVHERAWSTLSPLAKACAAALALLVLQHLTTDALFFFPRALPATHPLLTGAASPLAANGFTLPYDYRVAPETPDKQALATWLDAHRDEGRVAIQTSELGEAMAARSKAEILGGFLFCNLQQARSNLFRRLLEEHPNDDALRAHLEAYAVRYVVLSYPEPRIDHNRALFTPFASVAGYGVFRTTITPRLIADGPGQARATVNRIAVWDSDPTRDVVLRYHFHEALRCGSGCKLTRAPNPTGGAAFIRIAAPHPAAFVLENVYAY